MPPLCVFFFLSFFFPSHVFSQHIYWSSWMIWFLELSLGLKKIIKRKQFLPFIALHSCVCNTNVYVHFKKKENFKMTLFALDKLIRAQKLLTPSLCLGFVKPAAVTAVGWQRTIFLLFLSFNCKWFDFTGCAKVTILF